MFSHDLKEWTAMPETQGSSDLKPAVEAAFAKFEELRGFL
jgi:hypothetical protein